MSNTPAHRPAFRLPQRLTGHLVTLSLSLAAILTLAFHLVIGLDPDDSENLESSLALVASRQLTDGFGSLYGPFSGDNPRVLIQAPLYYRLTALTAIPLVRAGVDPVWACFLTGRLISSLSFFLLLIVAFRLASVDGASSRAGWWAVLLIASTPALGSFPVTVRPDLLGILLQTLGVGLVLRVLQLSDHAQIRRNSFRRNTWRPKYQTKPTARSAPIWHGRTRPSPWLSV